MTAVAVDAMLPLLAVVPVMANLSTLGTRLFVPVMGFPMAESLAIVTAQWVLDATRRNGGHPLQGVMLPHTETRAYLCQLDKPTVARPPQRGRGRLAFGGLTG